MEKFPASGPLIPQTNSCPRFPRPRHEYLVSGNFGDLRAILDGDRSDGLGGGDHFLQARLVPAHALSGVLARAETVLVLALAARGLDLEILLLRFSADDASSSDGMTVPCRRH